MTKKPLTQEECHALFSNLYRSLGEVIYNFGLEHKDLRLNEKISITAHAIASLIGGEMFIQYINNFTMDDIIKFITTIIDRTEENFNLNIRENPLANMRNGHNINESKSVN